MLLDERPAANFDLGLNAYFSFAKVCCRMAVISFFYIP